MKCALLLLAVLGLAASASIDIQQPPVESQTIVDDWVEFVALIPRIDLLHILINHLTTDTEFQNVIWFLISDPFEAQVVALDAQIDFLNFLDYLETQNINIYNFLNTIHEFLGIPLLPPQLEPRTAVTVDAIGAWQPLGDLTKNFRAAETESEASSKSLASMWAEMVAVWPGEDIVAFHENKMENSTEYRAFFDSMASPECRDLLNKVVVLPEWLAIVDDMSSIGINTEGLAQWLRNVLGWTQ